MKIVGPEKAAATVLRDLHDGDQWSVANQVDQGFGVSVPHDHPAVREDQNRQARDAQFFSQLYILINNRRFAFGFGQAVSCQKPPQEVPANSHKRWPSIFHRPRDESSAEKA